MVYKAHKMLGSREKEKFIPIERISEVLFNGEDSDRQKWRKDFYAEGREAKMKSQKVPHVFEEISEVRNSQLLMITRSFTCNKTSIPWTL